MTQVIPDAGAGDRLALAGLAQYRLTTTEQMHLIISPGVRIDQTRRRLAKLRAEGLIDRITLAQAGRTRVWFPTVYGARIAFEWPELRGRRPPRLVADRSAVRLRTGHALTVTETALAFLQDARHRGDVFRPLDWIPEVHHPLGNGDAASSTLLYSTGPCSSYLLPAWLDGRPEHGICGSAHRLGSARCASGRPRVSSQHDVVALTSECAGDIARQRRGMPRERSATPQFRVHRTQIQARRESAGKGPRWRLWIQ
ncbi:replication-relaxation family protein [Streptomyces fagopyri]|uniref:replication-relaxation family protein n=1 Tax=Streptomyces fagopyri TaxID=2662397 RepID=UPI0037F1ECAB